MPSRPFIRRLRRLISLGLCVAALAGTATALDAEPLAPASPPTVAEAEAELVAALAAERSLLTLRSETTRQRSELLAARSAGTDAEIQLRDALARARRDARQYAVGAFVAAGSLAEVEYVFGSTSSNDMTWRAELMVDHAAQAERAVERYQRLLDEASESLVADVLELDAVEAHLESIGEDLFFAGIRIKAAEQSVVIAEAHQRAAEAIAGGLFGEASDDAWARLRFCESSGNYQAVSRSGRYRGAYQFDLATWQSVGGSGDPAGAPPAEQDARARELFARRGDAPWPICGRHLR